MTTDTATQLARGFLALVAVAYLVSWGVRYLHKSARGAGVTRWVVTDDTAYADAMDAECDPQTCRECGQLLGRAARDPFAREPHQVPEEPTWPPYGL